jgi:transposase
VCIGLVVTPEGLPVAYEVFAGNRADVTTVEEMVTVMEQKYGKAGRVWVMDRGMVSEQNLSWMRERGAKYLVGTPKRQLREFEKQLLEKADWQQEWARQAHGAYLLRANEVGLDGAQFWKWYIQLTQAEGAFRVQKSDLGLRPVFHQKTHRVQGHILVCFLALALWRVLEQWMASKGLGNCARQLLKELEELRMMDVVLPTDTGVEVRMQVVNKPAKELAQLLAHLGLGLPQCPKMVADVVQKSGSK